MTSRELDPAVWAATFGAAFHDEYRTLLRTADHPTPAEIASMAGDYAADVADLAVRTLHPEPTGEPATNPSTADRLAALEAAERAYLIDAGWKLERASAMWIDPTGANRPCPPWRATFYQRDRDTP